MVQHGIALTWNGIKLTSLKPEHYEFLAPLANDKSIWEFNPSFSDPKDFKEKWFDKALLQIASGKRIPFYVEYKNQPVGSTSYYNIDLENQKINIGYTWFNSAYWGTGINQITKYLLFKHAFEVLQFETIRIQADSAHQRLLTRLERLGVKQTEVIENHKIGSEGKTRTTIIYSINKTEWPQVKTTLESQLKEAVYG